MQKAILYLSAGTDDTLFQRYQQQGYIKGGFQAQKFNSLLIKGLAEHQPVRAIANLPFAAGTPRLSRTVVCVENVEYITLEYIPGRFHKIANLFQILSEGRKIGKTDEIEAVVCDAINPLASVGAYILSCVFRIPKVGIITDIPELMDQGRETIFTKITSHFMKKYDGYVLLTDAMNEKVNHRKKPFIVMEGVCEASHQGQESNPSDLLNKNVCMYTGTLAEGTGIENLLQGFMQANLSNTELHIYGNGACREKVIAASKQFQAIQYKGIAGNDVIVREQQKAALLINPRPKDVPFGEYSFPSKIMEYMVSGTPVLSTRLPGIPKEYFEYIYSLDNESASGITKAIKEILEIPLEERMTKGQAARQYVSEYKNKYIQSGRILELIGKIKSDEKSINKRYHTNI